MIFDFGKPQRSRILAHQLRTGALTSRRVILAALVNYYPALRLASLSQMVLFVFLENLEN
jgi:hypothetical protein